MTKIQKLQEFLLEKNLDALLVTSATNRRYVTGFTGSAGIAVIVKEGAYFLTDFRYTTQANEQVKGFHVIQQGTSIYDDIKTIFEKHGVKRVGFEESFVTVSSLKAFQAALPLEWEGVSGVIEKLRMVKFPEELVILKQAATIADQAFSHILTYIRPGLREIDVANELEFFMRKQGASSSSFDIIVASGVRSSLPHGVATSKVIETGDFVTLDFGARYEGYISDLTRTIAVGHAPDKLKEIYHIVLEAQQKALDGIRPGLTGIEADALSRDVIKEKGYGAEFGHSLGHGIGLDVHEGPNLSFRSDMILEKNMVVTVEPGIYINGLGGVRIEDDILLTETGNERITFSPKELLIV